jgi:hypothetical protein
MGSHHKGRFWRLCRIYFRRFRISVWLLLLTVLAAVVYVNQVGLPDVLKRPLLEKLREQGLDLRFTRLRLSWHQGIVAENVHFGPAEQEFSPNLSVAEVEVRLNWNALAHLQIQVDSLMLRQGKLSWAYTGTNQTLQALTLSNIQTDLRFLPNDQWALDNFKALFAGANIQLAGVVTNASAVREWAIFKGGQPASRSAELWQGRFRRIGDTLNQIHFSAPPELRVNVRGDALDLRTFNVLLSLSAPGAQTPWGTVAQGRFAARLFSVDSNGVSRADLVVHAGDAQTPWASVTNSTLSIHLNSFDNQSNLVNGELKLTAAQTDTRWAQASNTVLTATWTHSITNPIPISGRGRLGCDYIQTPWAKASDIQLRADLEKADVGLFWDESWAWWTNLQPYRLNWDCRFGEFNSPKFVANRVSCGGSWQSPRLVITNLEGIAFQGHLTAQSELDVGRRSAKVSFSSDCDPNLLASILPEEAQKLLAEFSWSKAPEVKAELALTMPAWTNQQPNWQGEVLPTLQLRGELNLPQGGAFRQLQVDSLHAHFLYSNQCWYLPDLALVRPEGRLDAECTANELTREFYGRISSTIDPLILRPFLSESAQPGFKLLSLSQPPALALEIRGDPQHPEDIGVRGHVSLTNFTFRGEKFTALQTQLEYTNRVLRFLQPRVQLGTNHLQGDGVMVDLEAQLVHLTNGFSNADPMVIARAIGPQIARDIEDYQFGKPPTARIHGTIPLHGEEAADLHFELSGGPFHWWKFNVPHITGQVHWLGLHLAITNVDADFYHGAAVGWASFEFPRNGGTDFQFAMSVTNVLFRALMADLSTTTNRAEGHLEGNLSVTKANTDTWQSVFGHGEARLHDGLLWDIPVFGIFSPILNGIAPGLGNSRASSATSSFVITNGVIRSTDFEIRSTAMRLLYRGTVNLESQLNARVDAELLRDMWVVGPLISTVLWPVTKLFEYRVTGTLSDPRTEPVFIIPKIMLMPFHPFRTLKGLRPEDPNSSPNFAPLPP